MDRPRILLDCDPGIDDAVAILTAAHLGELVGITTVSGNVDLDHTTHNALVTCQIAGLDVEVHAGADRPLVAARHDAARIHGATGLGDVELPALTRAPASADAVDFLLDTARAVEGLHLVAVGPLTNVALALRLDPTLPDRLASLTVMGGAFGPGNATPAAEFNIWADPEAAAIVFDHTAGTTMIGLDVTHRALLGPDALDRLRAGGGPVAGFAAGILERYRAGRGLDPATAATPVHDAAAVVSLTHPDLFTVEEHPVAVELAGTHTRGATVVDRRAHAPRHHLHRVAVDVDGPSVIDLVVDAVRSHDAGGGAVTLGG